jgi:hypothetical protein
MRCDSRTVCSQCSIYLWKPTGENKSYFFCRQCKNDILCDRGITKEFEYDEDKTPIGVTNRCVICRTEVVDKTWPEPTGTKFEMVAQEE